MAKRRYHWKRVKVYEHRRRRRQKKEKPKHHRHRAPKEESHYDFWRSAF